MWPLRPGIDWLELIIQVALAAVGVSVVAGIYHIYRRSKTDKVKDAFKKLESSKLQLPGVVRSAISTASRM